MNATIKETLNYIQGFSGKIALVVSLAVAGFLMMSENTECLHAQAICQVGSDPTFTQPIKITGTGTNTATLSAANVTANRTLTLPDVDGALIAGTLTNDAPFIAVSSTGALDTSQTLTASTPLKSNALGQITAADLVPETDLTVGSGSANQVLSIDGAGTALVFRNETSPTYTANAPYIKVDAAGAADTSSTLTANSPCLKADASGQIEACPSLTNSTPLKASATGQIEASDLDITTDITAGAALQQIRTNAAGNALEFFTPPAVGGAWTLVDSGTMINASATSTVLSCWYGNTLDPAKRYKFVMDGGTGTNIGVSGYSPLYYPIKNDCSTGTKTYWDSGLNMRNASTHVGVRATSNYQNTSSACFTVQGADANHGSSLASNIEGDIEFSALDNGNDYGFWSQFDMAGTVYSGTSVVGVGIQWGTGSCIGWGTGFTDAFSDITGFAHVLEGGSPAPNNRNWALYEIDY